MDSKRPARSLRPWVAPAIYLLTLTLSGLGASSATAALRDYNVRFLPSTTPGVTEYLLFVREADQSYSTGISLGVPQPDGSGVSSRTVQLEGAVDNYLALRALGSNGVLSAFSNEIVVAALPPPPECSTDGDCSDGNACNGAETCSGGNCAAGTAPSCSVPDQCKVGSCDAALGCVVSNQANGTPCNDGSAATLNDVCTAGVCAGTVPPDPAPACSTDDDCSDGDACNGAETCSGGNCVAGTAPSCSVPDQCKVGYCHTLFGCITSNQTNGTACDDGSAATLNDVCTSGVCAGTVPPDPACTTDADCTDGNACNGAETCSGGSCAAGTAPSCSVPDQCKVGYCNTLFGCLVSNLANGTACDDGSAATENDVCTSGVCAGTVPPPDPGGQPPNNDLMNALTGIASLPYSNDDVRPAWCDVDGDGQLEVVSGFGPGSEGRIRVMSMSGGGDPELLVRVGLGDYETTNGETMPACGDLDGDGRDEIVIGLGNGGGGRVFVLDDASTGFAPYAGTPAGDGWVQFTLWASYIAAGGSSRPTVGDFDGDGRDEVAIGLGQGGGGWIFVLDDAAAAFAPYEYGGTYPGWVQFTAWSAYLAEGGSSWVDAGDVDGDGVDEIVVGLGPRGGGWIFVVDDAINAFTPFEHGGEFPGWVQATVWPDYLYVNGSTWPTVGDIDGDGVDEIVVGLGRGGGGFMVVLDDAGTGFAPHASTPAGDGWLPFTTWPEYLTDDGSARPTAADIDGDGFDETLIMLGPGYSGQAVILDDATRGFQPHPDTSAGDGWLNLTGP